MPIAAATRRSTVARLWRLAPPSLLVLLGALGSAAPGGGQELRELMRGARQSVMLLRLFDAAGQELGSGTGFLVRPDVVATNYHVADGAYRVEAVLFDERQVEVSAVIVSDADNDLALLRVPALDIAPLPLSPAAETIEPGDPVIVLGSPRGLAGTISDGIVAALRPQGLGADSRFFASTPLIQITAPISPGSSGSPVIDAQGRVIGVAVSTLAGQNLNFAIPASSLEALLRSAAAGQVERTLGAAAARGRLTLVRNLGISALFFAAVFVAFRLMKDR